MPKNCAAIVIAAKHGNLIKVKDYSGITDTVGALRCKFEFRTNDWDNASVTAVFCKGNMATHPEIIDNPKGVILDDEDECAVPSEVLTRDAKYFSVGIWGVTDTGLRIVSDWLVFRIKDGCYVDSTAPIEPTPTVYEQIMMSLNTKAPIDHTHDNYVSFNEIQNKQDTLVSGVNIKTINGEDILGSGDIVIESGGSSGDGSKVTIVDEFDPNPDKEYGDFDVPSMKNFASILLEIAELFAKNDESVERVTSALDELESDYAKHKDTFEEKTNNLQTEMLAVKNDVAGRENRANKLDTISPNVESRFFPTVKAVYEYGQKISNSKQDFLVSGENIKTINGQSILGEGDITIEGVETDGESSDVSGLRAELKTSIGETTYNKDITNTLQKIEGQYYNKDNGNLTTYTGAECTELFAVNECEKYFVSGSYGYFCGLIAEFDETKAFIRGVGVAESNVNTPDGGYEYIVPAGVSYIGCSTRRTADYGGSGYKNVVVLKEVTEYNNIPKLIDELEAKHNEDISRTEQKIEEDIVALDEKITLTVDNICPNSDFVDTSVWELGNTATTMTVKNNVATLTNDGSGTQTRIRMPLDGIIPQDHIVYVQASIKSSPNAIWESFNFYTDKSYDFIHEKPALKNSKSLFNDYYGTFDFSQTSTSSVKLWITSTYNIAANAKDQVTHIKNVFICDLTESFGAGNEPSASEFYNILKAGGSWFKGSKQIFMVDLIKPTLPIVSDYVITVGENGDCQTINEAIERASSVYPVYKKRGIKVEIRILDGTIIDEQILVESLDLSYISITTDNADNKVIVTPTATNWDKNSVSHDSRGNMPFFAGEHGARLPVIKCLFSCTSPMLQIEDKTIGIVGYYCNRGSMGVMAVGAAYPENTTQSGAGDIEAEVGFEGFYDCVIANNNSEITLRECIARNAGRYGIMSRHISRISARSADLTNCGTIIKEKVKNNETVTAAEKEITSAAYADRSSMMDVRFANVSGSYNGIQSFNTSNVTAVETIANDITNIVADARAGSIINCDIMTINNVKDVFMVSKGGSIVATGANLSNVTGTTYNVTTDIYTSNGVIYVTANKESGVNVQTINGSSTHKQYPTAKAVYDYIDEVIGGIENGSY